MKLIDKDTLVAEIKRRRDAASMRQRNLESIGQESVVNEMIVNELNKIISLIDTLEVKEMDLEEALSDLDKDIKEFVTTEEFENESTTAGHYWVIAKHAFLLGLKAQKGESV